MSADDQLTALDATFLELEEADDGVLMHIGGALVFASRPGGGTPTIDEIREHVEQCLDRLPRYRQKLDLPRTGGLSWPSWKRDERFEIAAHVRHATLPAPGDERDFLDWVSDFYSHRLDRSRPLWEMVLLDGLADGWALLCKTHHCLVDGVGSLDFLGLLLGAAPAPPQSSTSPPADGSHGWLPNPFGAVTLLAGAGVAAAHLGSHAVLHPRDAFERSRGVVELLIRAELFAAPASSLNVPIGSTRLFATVNVDFHELQDIRSALGGTVNDVVLCAATGALRALLLERGEEPPRGLRAMVPVSVRREGDGGELGNQVSSLFVDLPVAESDPLRRYELVSAATKRLKAGGQAHAASALTDLTELAPPVLHAGLARSLFAKRLFNVTITNVPGPPSSLSAFGSELLEILPIVPLAADHALGIAVVSYAGAMTFGVFADRASVPDLDVLRDGIVTALSELEALARAAPVH
ncbi:wax ester/triacylglycerol synthase family O-acyltransferase [Solirubrobacter ginsenosidimutans]|uniref:Diacylglycerol O-acyltransferase n=1 Tax=Solirubrobacter ginsenosidimutans TaxID=490573 RepID=A0A9X3N1G9_9ACTN|nr:wax ester/triacylglycerol synthase family O-acyltransferase [Solirubrobacter ginsenosidimutans]MDA0164992.1 wax ester/triacylglycerol synthase family O-acyltransferase [Solirubrobacter ginsenosidimutans]